MDNQDMNITIVNDDMEIIKQDIVKYISLWLDDRELESRDICKVSQNRWYNCCKFIYEKVFKDYPEKLKVPGLINNQYDLEKVNNILDIYIDLCNDYEKVINITGFTFFTGIHRDTINDWSHDDGLDSSRSDISKKLDLMREESLVGLQVSGKGHPMNYMPSLNKYCGFNMPGVREQNGAGKVQSIEAIQAKYKAPELSENDTQLELPKAGF